MSRPATNEQIARASDDIVLILREFASPKDAASALTLANFGILTVTFVPARVTEAIASVDAEAALLKQMLQEGWQ